MAPVVLGAEVSTTAAASISVKEDSAVGVTSDLLFLHLVLRTLDVWLFFPSCKTSMVLLQSKFFNYFHFHLPLSRSRLSYPLKAEPELAGLLILVVDGLCSDHSPSPPPGLLEGIAAPAVDSTVIVVTGGLCAGTGCEIALIAIAVGVVVFDLIRPLEDVLGTWFMREYFSEECCKCCCCR